MNLPTDVIKLILDYLILDIKSISKLSECNNRLLKLCRLNVFWVDYYKSLFPDNHFDGIGTNSEHKGPIKYITCEFKDKIYPGWDKVNDSLDPKIYKCTIVNHYTNIVQKPIRFKNIWKQCVRRKYTLEKQKYTWSYSNQRQLDRVEQKYLELKNKKLEHLNILDKFGFLICN
jgi:hypothetical protein